jgi:hypothetical protein
VKYFNFLLENDINFSRDEQGNYVALVKVLNPAFYGGSQDQKQPSKSPIKSTSPIFENKDTLSQNNDTSNFKKNRSSSMPQNSGKMKNQKNLNDNNLNKGFDFEKNDNFGNLEGNISMNNQGKKMKDMKKINTHFEKEKKPVR